MKASGFVQALLALALFAPGCAMYSEDDVARGDRYRSYEGDYSLFYDDLSPYGRWFEYGNYGYCWSPYDVSYGWRPYTAGRWAYTDAGWLWVSEEPFGWATYHYGRWVDDDDYGWVWVPDRDWGPSWVAWRYSDDWVGWAPLPPGTSWNTSAGISWSDDLAARMSDDSWCFVPSRSLLDARIRERVAPPARNRTLVRRTQVRVLYDTQGGRPRNIGLDERLVEGWTRRPVPRARVRDEQRPRGTRWSGSDVGVYRPTVRGEASRPPREAVEVNREREARDADAARRDEAETRTRREEERRQLEQRFENERRRLEAEHRAEEARGGKPAEELRRQHDEEMRALEQEKERQSRILESRHQKGIVRGGKDRDGKENRGNRGRGR